MAMQIQTNEYVTIPGFADSPVAESAQVLIEATQSLGDSQAAAILRSWCVPHIFAQREAIFDSNDEPISAFDLLLRKTAGAICTMRDSGFSDLGAFSSETAVEEPTTVEDKTGQHYGNLFRQFSPSSYWDETASLLSVRLERNGIDLATIAGKSVLDAGCGGGRYTGAWRRIGASPALGVDISPINISDARRRAEEAAVQDLNFQEANVLDMPLENNAFDIVFSNGVLHHTRDWECGVSELLRVLKPGGIGWLYLIENPGGLFWYAIEILREVMRGTDRETARKALAALGIPANRIFYMLDHVMVPINIRLTPLEIETCLETHGATGIRRLTRGADFDRIERIWQGEPFAAEKFGVGENRYIFTKA
jgi:SAM-dependent methyltransferase